MRRAIIHRPGPLSLAVASGGAPGVWAIAGDTDGVDGAEEVTGAVVAPSTLARPHARGLSARAGSGRNDGRGRGFFGALGDRVVTGPTLADVNASHALLVAGRHEAAEAQAAEAEASASGATARAAG